MPVKEFLGKKIECETNEKSRTEVRAGIILKMKRKRAKCKPGKRRLLFCSCFPS